MVRHSTMLEKMAKLDMPEYVYNWLVEFFSEHSHCTVYNGQTSTVKKITASIIQGSGIGPAAYVVTAGDLTVTDPGNKLVKFADDTYLVIPATSASTRTTEIENVELWAQSNNLSLNRSKTREVIFSDMRKKQTVLPPAPLPGITRDTSLKILGVTITGNLSASDHIRGVVSDCSQTLYALRVLRNHGLCDAGLQAVFRSVVVAKILYASTAWSGFITATDRQRVDAFLRRSKRCGFCPPDLPSFELLLEDADQQLFDRINSNVQHVLHRLLPPPSVASQHYELRRRAHSRELPARTGRLTDSNFVNRVLFADIYWCL